MGVLRPMTVDDVSAVVAGQGPAAVVGLADVFPQHTHPFPADEVTARWRREVVDPAVDCYVIEADDAVAGFAAVRGAEFLHFGVDLAHWGTGLAGRAHDEVLDLLRSRGVEVAWLRVFTGNARGRRFYERRGWVPTGERSRTSFPPHPELLGYTRALRPRST